MSAYRVHAMHALWPLITLLPENRRYPLPKNFLVPTHGSGIFFPKNGFAGQGPMADKEILGCQQAAMAGINGSSVQRDASPGTMPADLNFRSNAVANDAELVFTKFCNPSAARSERFSWK